MPGSELEPQPGPDVAPGETRGPWYAYDRETLRAFIHALRLHESRYRIVPRIVPVTSPAAGTDWSVSVEEGRSWVLLSVRAQLVSSAAVATRLPVLTVGDGTDTPVAIPSGQSQAAALMNRHAWLRGGAPSAGGTGNVDFLSALPLFSLFGGLVISSVTGALQAADQWSAIRLLVLQYEERLANEAAQTLEAIVSGEHSDLYPAIERGF